MCSRRRARSRSGRRRGAVAPGRRSRPPPPRRAGRRRPGRPAAGHTPWRTSVPPRAGAPGARRRAGHRCGRGGRGCPAAPGGAPRRRPAGPAERRESGFMQITTCQVGDCLEVWRHNTAAGDYLAAAKPMDQDGVGRPRGVLAGFQTIRIRRSCRCGAPISTTPWCSLEESVDTGQRPTLALLRLGSLFCSRRIDLDYVLCTHPLRLPAVGLALGLPPAAPTYTRRRCRSAPPPASPWSAGPPPSGPAPPSTPAGAGRQRTGVKHLMPTRLLSHLRSSPGWPDQPDRATWSQPGGCQPLPTELPEQGTSLGGSRSVRPAGSCIRRPKWPLLCTARRRWSGRIYSFDAESCDNETEEVNP